MILVDSSGWIEYLGGGPKAENYGKRITQNTPDKILTPTVVVLEVYRKIKKERGEDKALEAYAHLGDTRIITLDSHIALTAADLSLKAGLGTVDAIIYATATLHRAELLTSDHHFEGLPGVTLV